MQAFREILDENLLTNCPCTSKDDKIVEATCGKDVSTTRGRKFRETQQQFPALMPIYVDCSLKEPHKNVVLFADIFWLNVLPFLLTASESIGLISSALLPNREKDALRKFLDQVFLFCTKHGFLIDCLEFDLEFKCLEDET